MRKPDKETELMRMWKYDKKDKNAPKIEGYKVKYKGKEFELCGFNICTKDKEFVFAYKFKHNDKGMVYFVPEGKENNKDVLRILNEFRRVSELTGYAMIDSRESLDSALVEMDIEESKTKRKRK